MSEELRTRQKALVELNLNWLRQAEQLLESLQDTAYGTVPAGMPLAAAGSHLRHVLDFYDCFLDGLQLSHIDYNNRRRGSPVEANRRAALDKIREILGRLDDDQRLMEDAVVFVKMEDDADPVALRDRFLLSSTGRELQMLSGHTVHHFALIAISLRAHGWALHPDFGVAPSTLRYRSGAGQAA